MRRRDVDAREHAVEAGIDAEGAWPSTAVAVREFWELRVAGARSSIHRRRNTLSSC